MSNAGLGHAFALSCAVCWAAAVILLRRSGESMPAFELNLFKNTLSLFLLIPTLALTTGLAMPEYPIDEVFISLLSGFLGIAVADTWYLRALNLAGASRTGIVASLFSPFVIMLSALFLGESLIGLQFLGLVLVLMGILLITWRQNRRQLNPENIRKGALLAAGAVFMMAVGIVMVKEILETRSFMWTLSIRMLGGVGGMLIYMILRRRLLTTWRTFQKPQPWVWIITGSVLASYLSMMLWLGGYALIPASEASVLNESASAWIVLFAWLILGESVEPRKIAGLVLTFAGVVILLLV